ncbi:hypothetical protein BU26DRAFT_553174 [Trematosphaeria pertusa]|uniref:Uncharacterized protein n=1 Tax=Trematosphaeria pertusa TaxID=390896 RepID=A0A6A6I7J1_9PLEO|nr:uncharacterized protein BU26DRAFT_553174 [Trematosphaeria pertusa]KAF2246267.1 hypothetical protein BU26DRAFT_553174 [Trematosphaeria pertusa]
MSASVDPQDTRFLKSHTERVRRSIDVFCSRLQDMAAELDSLASLKSTVTDQFTTLDQSSIDDHRMRLPAVTDGERDRVQAYYNAAREATAALRKADLFGCGIVSQAQSSLSEIQHDVGFLWGFVRVAKFHEEISGRVENLIDRHNNTSRHSTYVPKVFLEEVKEVQEKLETFGDSWMLSECWTTRLDNESLWGRHRGLRNKMQNIEISLLSFEDRLYLLKREILAGQRKKSG